MAGDIFTASGTKFSIGPSAGTASSVSEYAALTPYTLVGLIETFGEVGDESSAVTFAAIGDGRTRKAKGARDAGTMTLTVGDDALDAGQLALIAAEGSNVNFAFKMVLPDRSTVSGTDTTLYFRGLVMSKRLNVGGNDNVVRRTFSIGINSQIYEVPAT